MEMKYSIRVDVSSVYTHDQGEIEIYFVEVKDKHNKICEATLTDKTKVWPWVMKICAEMDQGIINDYMNDYIVERDS